MKKLIIAALVLLAACKKENEAGGMLIVVNQSHTIHVDKITANGKEYQTVSANNSVPANADVAVTLSNVNGQVLLTMFDAAGAKTQQYAGNGTFSTKMKGKSLSIYIPAD